MLHIVPFYDVHKTYLFSPMDPLFLGTAMLRIQIRMTQFVVCTKFLGFKIKIYHKCENAFSVVVRLIFENVSQAYTT